MEQEARALIKQLIKEGKSSDDIYKEIISHGYTTNGFVATYNKIQKEVDIAEPATTSTVKKTDLNEPGIEDVRKYVESKQVEPASTQVSPTSLLMTNIVKLVVGFLIIFVTITVFVDQNTALKERFFGDTGGSRDLSAGDAILKGTLDNIQNSAARYGVRMLGYEGVCESIGIDRAVYNCVENADAYAIEAPLSDGRFYCIDSTDFSDITDSSIDGRASCD